MRLIPLGGFCRDTLRPLSKAEVYRRAVRRAQIEQQMRIAAKASERHLPADERRQVIDLRELRESTVEGLVAMACAAPVAVALVVWMALTL